MHQYPVLLLVVDAVLLKEEDVTEGKRRFHIRSRREEREG
jgi:hypothetical protein